MNKYNNTKRPAPRAVAAVKSADALPHIFVAVSVAVALSASLISTLILRGLV